jgi:DNA (cytosine-5)-methyltransferase 1
MSTTPVSSTLTLGSICTGVGGLDLAVEAMTGATPIWMVENDSAASHVLAHRYPDVPNVGDLTTLDFDMMPHVDVLTAGYPCQPFSHAGLR